jgi:adenosine deaminase
MDSLLKTPNNPNSNDIWSYTLNQTLLILFIFIILLIIRILRKLLSKKVNKFIDLHLHLDGAITLDIAKKLAALQNIELPKKTDKELQAILSVQENCQSLTHFLECFKVPLSLLQTREGIREAVRLVADNIQSDGVIYAEIRFAPQLHKNKGLSQEDAINAALEGIKLTSLKVNLILCFMRGDDNEAENEETLELANKYLVKDGGVVAVDLAGAEALYSTSDYKEIFEKVKNYGIPYTIHAGEAAGADSVRTAIEFGAKRIGHGTRAFEDEKVVELIKDKGIFLEMCYTSNIQTHALKDMSKFPFMDYLKKGIKVTLNTDDMGIEGTTLSKEFALMERDFKLSYEQEKIILANSIDAAFTTDLIKAKLKKELCV